MLVKNRPTITAGIPVYNESNAIVRCVCSVLTQSIDQIDEILIVDDGSTDGTYDVLTRLMEKFSNIRVLRNGRNRGRPFTRSRLLEEASSDYFAMLDADDAWYPDKIERQLKILEENNYQRNLMVCGNIHFRDIGTGKSRVKDFAGAYQDYSIGRLLKGDNIPISQLALANTGFLREVGEFDGRLSRAQDWDFLIRFFSRGGEVAFVPGAPLALFNFNTKGRNWREIVACLELVVAKHHTLYEAHDIDADATMATMRGNYVSEFRARTEGVVP